MPINVLILSRLAQTDQTAYWKDCHHSWRYIIYFRRPSWVWSHSSWIYNYLYNQCLSPLKSWVRILLMARSTW